MDDQVNVRKRAEYIRGVTKSSGKSRTKQSFRDDCDINRIVKQHASSGMYDHVNNRTATYGDFTAAAELSEALQVVAEASNSFDVLPAEVRALCGNDPVTFLSALADQETLHELVQAGLPMDATYEPPAEPDAQPPAPLEPPVPPTT